MPLGLGERLSHYRIGQPIGEGGVGVVYLAHDTKLDRKVALKVLNPALASDTIRLARFEREAKALAALNHPHIVTIHSVEKEGDVHFLTMELVEGESLAQQIPAKGLPLTKVYDVGIALADALTAAHEKGVVHRDLKPGNVMLTRDGRPKVLDFGLAKLVTDSSGFASDEASQATTQCDPLTGRGAVMGTVPYMSPEQAQGRAIDARTDIFSLGVVLYEMTTGRRPFWGKSPAEIVSQILRDAPRPVAGARPDVPRALERIIDQCLQKDPGARFQTARDVRDELRAMSGETETAASPAIQWPLGLQGALTAAAGLFVVAAALRLGDGIPGLFPKSGAAARHASAGAPAAVAGIHSIAVLPFTDLSPDEDQEYFSDGLSEELINVLVKIPDLKVAGRTSSFAFKGKNEDLKSIGERLGVAHVLEGSVRKAGDKVRITAQLVKAADGFHLWSQTYDRSLDDIFAVQDNIARSVARELQLTLLRAGEDAHGPHAEVYDLLLQARHALGDSKPESLRRGRAFVERALVLDPDYAPVWDVKGLLHLRERDAATTDEERRQANERTRQATAKALELDSDLATAHARMAGVDHFAWEFDDAQRSIEKALAAGPGDTAVLQAAAYLFKRWGRIDEAIALEEETVERDPLDLIAPGNLANSYLLSGRYDEAEGVLRKLVALKPDHPPAHGLLGDLYLMQGEVPEARAAYKRSAELQGQANERSRLFYDALLEHAAGNEAVSAAAAAEFETKFGAESPVPCAGLRAWRGEADLAFAWLDRAFAVRSPTLSNIKSNALLRGLHADARWRALLGRIGLPAG